MTEANSINAATAGIVGNTGTAFTGTAVTQYNVITGGSTTSTLNNVAPSSTSGVPVISQGAASQPIFGTAVVAGGGTGATTLTGILTGNGTAAVTANTVTQHGVLIGGVSNAASSTAVGATATVLIGNTGADPTFSATPTVTSITFGSGTALSVYEEGTFIPTLVGNSSAGTTTYAVQNGYYTKIGNMVTIWGNVAGSAATGTGTAIFGALPFTIKSQTNYTPIGTISIVNSGAAWVFPTGTTYLVFVSVPNTNTAYMYGSGTAGADNFVQMANASFDFLFAMSYQV